jgi:hypothetical protein
MIGIRQRHFFGVHLAAGSTYDLGTSMLGQGVALAISQATLADPLPPKAAAVQLLCNGMVLCSLSRDKPNARVPTSAIRSPCFECFGPEGSAIHLVGYTFVRCRKRPVEEVEEETDGQAAADYVERMLARKRRIAQLQREAAAEAARPSTEPSRIPRLTFSPEVLAATYSRTKCDVPPVWVRMSLDEMVTRREEIKARQALETDDDGEDNDDGEELQHVLAVLLSTSPPKLRALCEANGLDAHGAKSSLIERLVDYVAADMRTERASRTEVT